MWLHIDGAYGGGLAMLPEYECMTAGWEEADSIVINPHKTLFVPLDFSVLYVRDLERLRRVFTLVPEYLRGDTVEAQKNYMDYGIQLGRRFRALKLWFVMRHYGRDGLAESARTGRAAEVVRHSAPLPDDVPYRPLQSLRRHRLPQVPEHQRPGQDERRRIRLSLSGDIGRTAMHRLKHGMALAHVCSRNNPEPAYESGSEIGDDVAIEIWQQQDVECFRPKYELHGRVIHDQFFVLNLRIFL